MLGNLKMSDADDEHGMFEPPYEEIHTNSPRPLQHAILADIFKASSFIRAYKQPLRSILFSSRATDGAIMLTRVDTFSQSRRYPPACWF